MVVTLFVVVVAMKSAMLIFPKVATSKVNAGAPPPPRLASATVTVSLTAYPEPPALPTVAVAEPSAAITTFNVKPLPLPAVVVATLE